jgi:hypothetical protein
VRVAAERDGGSISLLIIGYTAIAIGLIIAGIDVSKVFLAERAMASAADAAAVDAAQAVDTGEVYDGPDLRCGAPLPLDPVRAAAAARDSIEQRSPDLGRAFKRLDPPQTSVTDKTVTVAMRGEVAVPFGHLLEWLGIARDGGTVTVRDTAHATSPVTGSDAACSGQP